MSAVASEGSKDGERATHPNDLALSPARYDRPGREQARGKALPQGCTDRRAHDGDALGRCGHAAEHTADHIDGQVDTYGERHER